MSNRNYKERRKTILSLLAEFGEVSVDELAAGFDTSEVTIRKDLTELEKNGLLLRRHGGAIAFPQDTQSTQLGSELQSKQKQAIAQTAAGLVKDYSRIIIDSGSTTSALVPHLNQHTGLVIMTNALTTANQIQQLANDPTLLMPGGTWDANSDSFQGKIAESVIQSYDFDQLFIGADGVDIQQGTKTFNELVSLSQAMAAVSRQVIVLVESEKFGRRIPNLELEWSQIDVIITDSLLPKSLKTEIKQKGVDVIIANDNKD